MALRLLHPEMMAAAIPPGRFSKLFHPAQQVERLPLPARPKP